MCVYMCVCGGGACFDYSSTNEQIFILFLSRTWPKEEVTIFGEKIFGPTTIPSLFLTWILSLSKPFTNLDHAIVT